MIGVNESDCDGKELNVLKHEGFAMKHGGRWSHSSTQVIKDVDQALEALKIVCHTHGAANEGLLDLLEDVPSHGFVEAVSEEKTR